MVGQKPQTEVVLLVPVADQPSGGGIVVGRIMAGQHGRLIRSSDPSVARSPCLPDASSAGGSACSFERGRQISKMKNITPSLTARTGESLLSTNYRTSSQPLELLLAGLSHAIRVYASPSRLICQRLRNNPISAQHPQRLCPARVLAGYYSRCWIGARRTQAPEVHRSCSPLPLREFDDGSGPTTAQKGTQLPGFFVRQVPTISTGLHDHCPSRVQ